jgi:hypothetical protein
MDEAFIVTQIGNPEIDAVCDSVIMPANRLSDRVCALMRESVSRTIL